MGLFTIEEAEYESRRIEMEPNDLLVLGSDGLGSIESSSGDFFEDRELRATLSEQCTEPSGDKVLHALVQRAFEFGDHPSRPLPDDISLLTVQKK